VHNLASRKFGKDKQKWNKTCVGFGLSPRKFYSLLKKKNVTFNFNLKNIFIFNYERKLIFSFFSVLSIKSSCF